MENTTEKTLGAAEPAELTEPIDSTETAELTETAKSMDMLKLMEQRHSVRRYTDKAIEPEKVQLLQAKIDWINAETGLVFKLFTEEPEAFKANKPSYGSFKGCRNYFALGGRKGDDEKVGYYGEMLVLLAQELGLNTCWVALTFEKSVVKKVFEDGVILFDVIALGYGEDGGVPHRSKAPEKLSNVTEDSPEWFKRGVEAAALAPTAINQQKFFLELKDGGVRAKAFIGPCYKTDLGIVKYHFEMGAGREIKWL